MRLNVRVSLFTIAGLLCWTLSGAQTGFGKGNFSASLESNSIYYLQDSGLGESAPDDRFGSNNYLKMDYSVGTSLVRSLKIWSLRSMVPRRNLP